MLIGKPIIELDNYLKKFLAVPTSGGIPSIGVEIQEGKAIKLELDNFPETVTR